MQYNSKKPPYGGLKEKAPERYSVSQMRKMFESYHFDGFSGETCHKCKATANVLARGSGWFCACGDYNAQSYSHIQMPHEKPKYGPTAAAIRLALDLVQGKIGKNARRKKRDEARRQRVVEVQAKAAAPAPAVKPEQNPYAGIIKSYDGKMSGEGAFEKFAHKNLISEELYSWEDDLHLGNRFSDRYMDPLKVRAEPGRKGKRKGRNWARRGKKTSAEASRKAHAILHKKFLVLPDVHVPTGHSSYMKEVMEEMGQLDKPKKMLLVGSPGTGKSAFLEEFKKVYGMHSMLGDKVDPSKKK